MCDVAGILQTAQWCYQDATSIKPKLKSPWYENINNKISTLSSPIALLNKAKNRSKLSGTETIEAKRIIRKLNLTFEKPNDLTEAIVSIIESIWIYSKKLEMYAKCKERRRENQCFKLYRGRFYRRLSGESQMVHGVDVKKIEEYWSTMWVKSNVTNKNYEKYLVKYLFESEYTTTFPTFKEFEVIIKHWANWKAAGVDGIFNFFIKHISSVHKHLYEIMKDICLEGKAQDEWFYRGITYLIPKKYS